MASLNDPALLAFAGNLLSGGQQGGIGFGQSLGNALGGLAQAQLYKQEQGRQRRQALLEAAERSISMRAALGQLQQQQAAAAAQQQFVQSLPADQQAAAAVVPQQAALGAFEAANPDPITPYQQAALDQGQQEIDLARRGQDMDLAAQLAAEQQKALPKASDIAGLRKEFSSASGSFSGVRDGYKRLLSAPSNPAGDMSVIFGYMKMLDPTSVVRETEQATVRNAAGVPERVRNVWNRLVSGESLTPEQRTRYQQAAGALYREQFETQQQQVAGFSQIAQRAGMNPEDILQAVPMPEPETLAGEAFDDRIKALGADLSTIDQAAQEAGVAPEVIVQMLERKRRGI